jgi:C4-dicarboxylate transporter DctQ subunit
MKVLDVFFVVDDRLALLEKLIAMTVAALITLIIVAQVVLRYGFNAPLFWAEEAASQLMVFLTLLGLSLLIHSGRLISIEFVPNLASGVGKKFLYVLYGACIIALVLFLVWLSYTWMMKPQVRMEISPTTRIPRWYNYSVLPVALLAMAYHQLIRTIRQLLGRAGEAHA